MTSGQKVASSLLISVLVFSIFTVLAFSGLFDLVEVNYYQPVAKHIKEQKLEEIEQAQKDYVEILMTRFNIFEMNKDVKTYVDLRPSDISVQNREKIRAELMTNTTALLGIRIVDDNGRNVYLSTFDGDSLKNGKNSSISYKNYENLGELPYELVKASDWIPENAGATDKARIIKDSKNNRLVFSLPFYDSKNSFRGTILFYCDAGHLNRYLFSRNLIDMNGFGFLVAADEENKNFDMGFGGFVFGLPNYGQKSAENQILSRWKENPEETFWKIISEKSEELSQDDKTSENDARNSLCVFSRNSERSDVGFIALIYDESELNFPPYLRILLLAAAFITFYLIIFLIFSFKRDELVIIRGKIDSFKKHFIKQYKKRADIENDADLSSHKNYLSERIKKSLGKLAVKHESDVNALIEKSWNEILLELGKNYAVASGDSIVLNKNELRAMLEDILGSGKLKVQAVQVGSEGNTDEQTALPQEISEFSERAEENVEISAGEAVEEQSPAENVSVPQENEKTETADVVENVSEETEEVPAAEKDHEAESVEDEVEVVEAVEDIEEIEEAEEASELEEAEAAEDVEDLSEVEKISEAEPVEEVEALEEIEEAEEVSEVEEAADPEEVEELEEIEEIEEAEPAEEAEEIAETVDEVEELSEVEEIEEADSIEEIESVEELEEVSEENPAEEPVELSEDADDVEEVSEIEEAEEPDSLNETEPVEEIEELSEEEVEEEIEEAEEVPAEQHEEFVEELNDYAEEKLNSKENPSSSRISEFVEKIDFGVPEISSITAEENNAVENFAAVRPDFAFLDNSEDEEFYGSYEENGSVQFTETAPFAEAEPTALGEEPLAEAKPVALEEEPIAENAPTALEEEPLTEAEPIALEEEPSAEDEPVALGEEPLAEAEPIALEEDPIAEAEPTALEEEPFAEAEPTALEEELLAEAEPAALQEEPLAEAEPAALEEEPLAEAEPIALEEEPLAEAEPIALGEEPLTEAEPIALEEEPSAEDEPTASEEEPSAEAEPAAAEKSSENIEENVQTDAESAEDLLTSETEDELEILEECSALEELDQPEETMPFTFTQLAANNSSLAELSSEAPDTIVQNSDGTYRISDNKNYMPDANLDQNFKKLVDSVLR